MILTVYHQVFGVALLLLVGFVGGKLARYLRLPSVAGYVLAGALLSPSLLNVIPQTLNQDLFFFKSLGLGLIAMIVGGELNLRKIRVLGRNILVISIVEVVGTFLIVFTILYLVIGNKSNALLLGALATATAPAATVAVLREYRAKGRMTSTLLGIVAVDDAFCIVVVGLIASLVAIIENGMGIDPIVLAKPLIELAGSIGIGGISGLAMALAYRLVKDKYQLLVLMLGTILFNSGVADLLHLSPLLTNMVSGFAIANLVHDHEKLFEPLEDIELPVIVIFFTLAGAGLHLDTLFQSWGMALAYIVARAVGKVGSNFAGATLVGEEGRVRNNLGLAMLPKAGVSIGLLYFIEGRFPELAVTIVAIELSAVTFFEIIGPIATKVAIFRAGEVSTELEEVRKPSLEQYSNQ